MCVCCLNNYRKVCSICNMKRCLFISFLVITFKFWNIICYWLTPEFDYRLDWHWIVMRYADLFLFLFDDNVMPRCLTSMFTESCYTLNSSREHLFFSIPFTELFSWRSKITSFLFEWLLFDKTYFNGRTENSLCVSFRRFTWCIQLLFHPAA